LIFAHRMRTDEGIFNPGIDSIFFASGRMDPHVAHWSAGTPTSLAPESSRAVYSASRMFLPPQTPQTTP
jgi:hypothetical protein